MVTIFILINRTVIIRGSLAYDIGIFLHSGNVIISQKYVINYRVVKYPKILLKNRQFIGF